MRTITWQSVLRAALAILLLASAGTGSVAAHQRGDARLPTGEAEGAWEQLGIDFIAPAEAPATTASGETFVLPSSGSEVVVLKGDDVQAEDPSETDFADQVLLTIPGGIGAVAVIEGIGLPVNIMEAYVSGFAGSPEAVEEIAVEEGRREATGLYLIDVSGVPVYFFIKVDTATLPGNFIIQVAVASAGGIDESIIVLRENVLVDGVPMFEGIDEQALQVALDDYLGN